MDQQIGTRQTSTDEVVERLKRLYNYYPIKWVMDILRLAIGHICAQSEKIAHYENNVLPEARKESREWKERIRAQAEEIRLLKEDSHDWEGAYRERSALREEIERLKARGVSKGELALACKTWADSNDDRYLSNYIADFLRSKGLLIEDAAQVEQSRPAQAEVEDFNEQLRGLINRNSRENASNTPDVILAQYLEGCLLAFETAVQQRETWYGRDARPSEISPTKHRDFMSLPVEERRKQMEAQYTDEMVQHYEEVNAEADPLKVDLSSNPREVTFEIPHDLAAKHNALVDKCYELTQALGVNMLRWEEVKLELSKLEQRIESNDLAVAGAFDKAFAQIVALEEKVSKMAKEAE